MNGQAGKKGPDLAALRIEDQARNSESSSKRTLVIGILLLLVLVIAGSAALYQRKAVEIEAAVAKSPSTGGAVALLNASGYVTPRRRATVAAKVTGSVTDVFAEEGMRVEEGQVLATIDDADVRVQLTATESQYAVAQAALEDLQVNLANAERESKRNQELRAGGFVSTEQMDTTQTAVKSLRAKLAYAQEQVRAAAAQVGVVKQELENYTVRAPFAGIVVSKDAQRGEMVSPISAGGGFTRTGIATIVDMDSLEIEVDVNESYIARVKPGQGIEAILDAYPDWRIPAKVRTVIPTADRQKATIKVRIAFDRLEPRILPDMGVKVAFLAETQAKEAAPAPRAIVPRDAVRDENGANSVLVVKDERLEHRAVTIGNVRNSDLEIMAGLVPGDLVVVRGPAGLKDGQRVKIKQ